MIDALFLPLILFLGFIPGLVAGLLLYRRRWMNVARDRIVALRAALTAILASTNTTSDDMWRVPDIARQALKADDAYSSHSTKEPK